MSKVAAASVIVLVMGGLVSLGGQAPEQKPLAFDVASIKPNVSRQTGNFIGAMQPGGRFTATNWSVDQLLRLAYRIQRFQLSGGPGWVYSDTFDIAAKANRAYTSSELPWLLKGLLLERFKLSTHTDTRQYRRTLSQRTSGSSCWRGLPRCEGLGRG